MGEQEHSIGDGEIRDRILGGLDAFSELQKRFRRRLELHLLDRCGRHDGRSQEQAVEIVSQVLADCFTGSPSLLARWRGEQNLEAFLRTVAMNRLKSWWSSRDAAVTVDSDSRAIAGAEGGSPAALLSRTELAQLQEALAAGVEAALREAPEGVLFMRLKGLHGVGQRAISGIWGHHESQTSRRVREAMDLIRSTALHLAKDRGLPPEFEALNQAMQADPSILLGSPTAPLESHDAVLLQKLAAGTLDAGERDGAVELMCRNSEALAWFARHLQPEVGDAGGILIGDAALEGAGARIQAAIRANLDILTPARLRRRIDPLVLGGLADMLCSLSADGGTLWWQDPQAAVLEAVFNPFEPEIEGKRQPLVSGVISLALATSEAVLVQLAESHESHSPAIDASLGKRTRSMIAVPVVILGRTYGVLTAVRFEESRSFTTNELTMVERQSQVMAALFIHSLTVELTGGFS